MSTKRQMSGQNANCVLNFTLQIPQKPFKYPVILDQNRWVDKYVSL